jgi:DNA primase
VATTFDDSLMSEIRSRNNIVQVVGDYVSLKKAGGSYKGLCPFHGEKTPSFTVQESRQFFYCFGCQTGGDVISFVMEMHGYAFPEAVRHLADRVSISLPESRPQRTDGPYPSSGRREGSGLGERRARSKREKTPYYAVGAAAQSFFTDALNAMQGAGCRDYIHGRGLEAETVTRFGLGYAPDRWDGLAEHLHSGRQDVEVAQALGLIAPRKTGDGHYDRFRHRLTFPIRGLGGDIIGFGGRALEGSRLDTNPDQKPAKYINSPDSPVYSKGAALYGLYEARQAMRSQGRAVVVEGNIDVLMVAQAGLEAVVAPMGTALTPEQCRLIRRFVPKAVLVYDGDGAGRAAARKGAEMCLAEGLQTSVVTLPDGEDPDSYAATHGSEALIRLVDEATPAWTFLVDRVMAETAYDRDPSAATPRIVDALIPVADSLPDRRERELRLRSLAEKLRLDDSTMGSFVSEARSKQRPAFNPREEPSHRVVQAAPPPPERELRLLQLMLITPECRLLFRGRDAGELVTSPTALGAMESLADMAEDDLEVTPSTFVTNVEDPTLRALLAEALVANLPPSNPTDDMNQLLRQLRIDAIQRRIKGLTSALEAANRRGDDDAALAVLAEKRAYHSEIESLKQDL